MDKGFEKELEELINIYSLEGESDTPDFILATYLRNCLNAYNEAVRSRDKWFDYDPWSYKNDESKC